MSICRNIGQFVEGDSVEGVFLLSSHQIRITKNNSQFLSVTVADRTGSISGNCWDIPANISELKDGDFVRVSGSVTTYLGQLQLKYNSVEPVDSSKISAEERSMLVPCIDQNAEQLYTSLMNTVEKVQDEQMKEMAKFLLVQLKEKFTSYPAAKSVHHAEIGGLLQHSYEVVEYIKAVHSVTPWFDQDITVVAGLFHDIGKLREFSLAGTGLVSDYSAEGQLLGHIYMGADGIADMCKRFGVSAEKTLLLQHLILSHHGELEYGSPVKPATMEAYVLHAADELSARIHSYRDAVKDVEPGHFSEKQFALGGTKVYRPEYSSK